jgi:hypothetical protein
VIYSQFDDIEEKVDFLIELCKSLEDGNKVLQDRVESLEQELRGKVEAEERLVEEKAVIREKVDGLLAKLTSFSDLS